MSGLCRIGLCGQPSTMNTIPSCRSTRRKEGLRAARRGFSLLELMVVMAVLTMAVGMFSSTLISTTRLSRVKR
jgi:prepilin-type N-terminal cleavage/methylation domain-containing protein